MTTLVSWSPLPEIHNGLPNGLDQIIHSAFQAPAAEWEPRTDIFETEGELKLQFDLPGIAQNELEIVIEKGVLTLRGERKAPANMEQYRRVERAYGPFNRMFNLPESVDAERITANLSQGVLTLTLPTREESKPRQIQVQVQAS